MIEGNKERGKGREKGGRTKRRKKLRKNNESMKLIW